MSRGLDPDTLPKSWEEMIDMGKKLTRKDANGNVIQWRTRIPKLGLGVPGYLAAWSSPMATCYLPTSVLMLQLIHRKLWPLVVTNSQESRPVTVGLSIFATVESGVEWALVNAATLLTTAPLMVAFLIFQRRFVTNFMRAGIK